MASQKDSGIYETLLFFDSLDIELTDDLLMCLKNSGRFSLST